MTLKFIPKGLDSLLVIFIIRDYTKYLINLEYYISVLIQLLYNIIPEIPILMIIMTKRLLKYVLTA